MEMFSNIIKAEDDFADDEALDSQPGSSLELGEQPKSRVSLKSKVKFVSKMLKMQKVLREENENILKIKAMNNNKLPPGILLDKGQMTEAFMKVKELDAKNEMRPAD
jgi:serine/threonine-protein phosphatase 2B catalytic subunit